MEDPKKPGQPQDDDIATMLDLDRHSPPAPSKKPVPPAETEEESIEELLRQQRSLLKRFNLRDLFKKNKT